jgi:LmbE family N-acetylglucosaminyl deacetylase
MGDSGGFDPRIPRSAIPDIRRDEQEAAALELGVDDVWFLGYPDGRLAPSYALRRGITRVIRQVRAGAGADLDAGVELAPLPPQPPPITGRLARRC